MSKRDWIKLSDLADDEKIYHGLKIRLYNVGLNVENREDDYYDYLVSEIYDKPGYFQLVNISPYKAGLIITIIEKEPGESYSLGKILKRQMDRENSYVLLNY